MESHNNETRVVLGEVKAELARQNLSGRALAKMIDTSPIYVSRRLSGEVPISVADLTRVAGVLQVPVTQFFERSVA